MRNYKIAVAGTGYVGLSIATLLSQHHQVTAVDIIPEKVDLINNRKSPIQDDYIEKYLAEKDLNLTATLDAKAAYSDADFVVIAAPTNYDSHTQHFDTSAVEAVIKLVMEYNPEAIMVIKSTIPVGYTASVREKFNSKNIIFSPEFLRESKALYDNLYPSRIIVGTDLNDERLVEAAHEFAGLLQEGAIKENIDTLFKMQREHCSAGAAYDIFCEELETSLSVVFGGKAAQPETTLNNERLLLRSTIFAAVNKIYLDCCFDALRQEQALWSDILPDLA